MSNPQFYWYPISRKMIENIKVIENEKSVQAIVFTNAIYEALEETAKLPQGDLRIRAINAILINKTKTCEGVAQELFYEQRTINNWIRSFIKLVGRKAGY